MLKYLRLKWLTEWKIHLINCAEVWRTSVARTCNYTGRCSLVHCESANYAPCTRFVCQLSNGETRVVSSSASWLSWQDANFHINCFYCFRWCNFVSWVNAVTSLYREPFVNVLSSSVQRIMTLKWLQCTAN